jgi:hypothetical protein
VKATDREHASEIERARPISIERRDGRVEPAPQLAGLRDRSRDRQRVANRPSPDLAPLGLASTSG